MPNVNKRLSKVNERLAKIDRQLGFLEGRAYFKPAGTKDYQEITVIRFDDLGVTLRNFRTGEELQAQRYSVQVSRQWYLDNMGKTGRYAIRRRDGMELMPCEIENLSCPDGQQYATLDLRIATGVSYV